MDEKGEPAELIAAVNGMPVARFRPSIVRQDLASFQRQDVGFEVDLGTVLSAGDVVSVTNPREEHLSGSPHEFTLVGLTKEDKALWLISRDMKILEIGPSFNPVAPRLQGWRSFSLDHATQEELQAKYRDQQPIDKIEPVDFVWKGGPIESAVPPAEHGTFDALIASHVLEHIPDPISFFQSAAVLLNESGLVSLVMPDKRVMFDFFKPVSMASDWLLAHHERRTRHTKKTAFDNTAYNVSESHRISWSTGAVGEFNFFSNDVLREGLQVFDQTPEDSSGPYLDYHATVCTPSSLALIILELRYLGLLPFERACSFPVSGCEFYLTLRRQSRSILTPEVLRIERLKLMKSGVRELAEQARWLLDD